MHKILKYTIIVNCNLKFVEIYTELDVIYKKNNKANSSESCQVYFSDSCEVY